jgi:uncharacterized membrane protein YadS
MTMSEQKTKRIIDWSSLYKKEDWWALWIGLLLFFLSLPAYSKVNLLGWIPGGRGWVDVTKSIGFGAAGPSDPTAWLGLIGVWIFLLIILLPVGKLIGIKPRNWVVGFSVIFWISLLLWIGSFYKPLVQTFGSPEIGWVFALIVGMVLGNLPKLPQSLRDSARGEFFIKTAIVLLGAKILFTTLVTVILPVLESVFLAFPVVWVIAYFISRKMGIDQKFAATISSGVGICGISAAIATAGAIEAPGIYATMVSSIIVIFAAVELLIVPWLGAYFFPHHLNAAGVWMALSVKTDGAAAAAGGIVSSFLGQGASGIPAVMAVTTKVLIDVWIGLIALILAAVFAYFIEKKPGAKVDPMILWYRFPKFVLGYFFTSLVLSAIAFTYPSVAAGAAAVAPVSTFGTSPLQVIFFSLTFTSIGITTRFSALRQVGIGKPFAAYFIALMFAILWGGILAYLFFGGLP